MLYISPSFWSPNLLCKIRSLRVRWRLLAHVVLSLWSSNLFCMIRSLRVKSRIWCASCLQINDIHFHGFSLWFSELLCLIRSLRIKSRIQSMSCQQINDSHFHGLMFDQASKWTLLEEDVQLSESDSQPTPRFPALRVESPISSTEREMTSLLPASIEALCASRK